jgi:hypothetical protein
VTIAFQKTIPILRIFGVEKAKEFYVDYLGFSVDWGHPFEENTPAYLREPVPAIYGPSGDVKWDEADPTYSLEAAKRGGLIAAVPESSKQALDSSRYLHIQ